MQTVTVTGTGVVAVVPDSAVVRLAAVARGSGVAEAYAAMAAAAATVVEVAHRRTEERRVASSGISVWPARDHEGREAGYEARHSYAIACPDLATAGAHATTGSGLPFAGLSAALVAEMVGRAPRQ